MSAISRKDKTCLQKVTRLNSRAYRILFVAAKTLAYFSGCIHRSTCTEFLKLQSIFFFYNIREFYVWRNSTRRVYDLTVVYTHFYCTKVYSFFRWLIINFFFFNLLLMLSFLFIESRILYPKLYYDTLNGY